MRLSLVLGVSLSILASILLPVSSSPLGNETEPEIAVSAAFPEDNPFGHVVNGERNTISLTVENRSERNISLASVAGSVHNSDTNALVKNLSTINLGGINLLPKVKMQVPYSFYSEFKPGDLRLTIWVDHTVDDEAYRVLAYDSIVTIVEPEGSILDFKLISTYLVVSAILAGLVYTAYVTLFPQSKKPRRSKSAVSAPVGTVTATGAGGYQEEWIPEHHLRKTGRKKSGTGAVSGTSGDELSGGEELAKKPKGKKGGK